MADALFISVAILTIGSAIVALETRELVYGAIALAISMMGIAGFFLLLDSPFVAMFQITVYVGAVAVLVIFTVMLVRTQALFSIKEDPRRKAAGIVLLLVFIGGMGAVVLASGLGNPAFTKFNKPAIDVATIGKQNGDLLRSGFSTVGTYVSCFYNWRASVGTKGGYRTKK